jgi:alanyl-tRNA synthetase
MDANDRLTQQGNAEIMNEIHNQESIFRSIQDTINRIPIETGEIIRNLLNELVNFVKENNETIKLKNEEYMYQGFGLMMSEQQEQRRRFDEQNKESNEASINHHAIMMLKFEENEDNLIKNTSTINQSLNINEEKIEHKIETKAIEILTNIEKVEDRIILESEKTNKTIIQEEEMTRKVIIQSDGQVFANVLNLKNQLDVLGDSIRMA